MKILDNFRLDYGEIYKSIFGKALSAGEASAHAAAASGPKPSSTGAGAGAGGGAGAEGRKRGGRYVSREWAGDHWEYEYPEDKQSGHGLHHGDDDTESKLSHVLELPEGHDTSIPAEAAYTAAHQKLTTTAATHSLPNPNPDKGGNISVQVTPTGAFHVSDEQGKPVASFKNHGNYELWSRREAARPMNIMGPDGKPLVRLYKNVGVVGADGQLKPQKAGAGNAWVGAWTKPEDGGSAFVPQATHKEGIARERLNPLRHPTEASLMNQVFNTMKGHEKQSGVKYDPAVVAQVENRSRQSAGAHEVAQRSGKGAIKEFHDTDEINAMLKDTNDPFLKVIAQHGYQVANGKMQLNAPQAVKNKLVMDAAMAMAPEIHSALRKEIGKYEKSRDVIANGLGFNSFEDLNTNDKMRIAGAVAGALDNGALRSVMEKAVARYIPSVKPKGWQEGDAVAPADFLKFVRSNYAKELKKHVANVARSEGLVAVEPGEYREITAKPTGTGGGGGSRLGAVSSSGGVQGRQGYGSRTDQGNPMDDIGSYSPNVAGGIEGEEAEGQSALGDLESKISPEMAAAGARTQDERARLQGGGAEEPQEAGFAPGSSPVVSDPKEWTKHQDSQLAHLEDSATDEATHTNIGKLRDVIQRLNPRDPNHLKMVQNAMGELGFPGHFVNLSTNKSLTMLWKAIQALRGELKKAQPQSQQFLTRDKKVDPSHTYSHREGDEDHPTFFFRDTLGNYWRYTNAPTGHPDNSPRFGDATLHASEPTQAKASKFFDLRGRKLNRAPFSNAPVQWNPSYHPQDPSNLWAGRWVNPTSGAHEYAYMDSDVHDNPQLRSHQQLVTTDMRLPVLRMRVRELMSSPHIKDNVTATALALIDQGHFSAEEMATLSVGDVQDFGTLYKIGGRFVYPDHKMRTMLVALTKNRHPGEPLFSVPFVKKDGEVDYTLSRRMGVHYLMCTIDQIGLTFEGITKYHATQAFSRELQRMVIQDRVPWEAAVEYATLSVAQDMGLDVLLEGASATALPLFRRILIDPIALEILERNARKQAINGDSMPILPLPPPPVLYVSLDLTSRTSDEEAFSRWLHTFPAHTALVQSTLPNPANSSNMLEAVA